MSDPLGGKPVDAGSMRTIDESRWSNTLFNRKDGQNARKTVTFGDSSAVRSKPLWSLLALILLVGFWYFATRPYGLPSELEIPESLAEDGETWSSLSDKQRVTLCTQNESCADSYSQWIGALTFPSVRDTWNTFWDLTDEGFKGETLQEHARLSLWRVIRGMFFGSLIGIPVGFAMGLSSRLRGFFDAPVELFRPIPPFALIPLFILMFGIGDRTAVYLLIFASVWIMIIAARSGVQAANLSKVRAAYSLGASKRQVLFRVLLPNALPELFTGVRVSLGVCWGTLVAAELVGLNTGLGAMIFAARPNFRLDVVVVGIIVIALLGVFMDMTLRFAESKLIPWRGKG